MSHFGRPKGKPVEKYSLRPIGEYLHSLIHHPVIFSHDTIGEVPKKIVDTWKAAMSRCLRISAFSPARKLTTPTLRRRWPTLAIFMRTTRLAPRTARTHPRWALRNS